MKERKATFELAKLRAWYGGLAISDDLGRAHLLMLLPETPRDDWQGAREWLLKPLPEVPNVQEREDYLKDSKKQALTPA